MAASKTQPWNLTGGMPQSMLKEGIRREEYQCIEYANVVHEEVAEATVSLWTARDAWLNARTEDGWKYTSNEVADWFNMVLDEMSDDIAKRLFGPELADAEGTIRKGTIVTDKASRRLQWVYEMLPPDTHSAGRKPTAERENARKALQRKRQASLKQSMKGGGRLMAPKMTEFESDYKLFTALRERQKQWSTMEKSTERRRLAYKR